MVSVGDMGAAASCCPLATIVTVMMMHDLYLMPWGGVAESGSNAPDG